MNKHHEYILLNSIVDLDLFTYNMAHQANEKIMKRIPFIKVKECVDRWTDEGLFAKCHDLFIKKPKNHGYVYDRYQHINDTLDLLYLQSILEKESMRSMKLSGGVKSSGKRRM